MSEGGPSSGFDVQSDSSQIPPAQVKQEEVPLDELSFLGPFSVDGTDDLGSDHVRYDVEHARRRALAMIEMVAERIKTLPLGSDMRREQFLKTTASLRARSGTPTTLIAFCGATGAGKSSLINSILGERLVPTSGRQACTSFVTEISYNPKPGFTAQVEFLTMEEWQSEISDLLADLKDLDGVDHADDIEAALHKVKAVYPSISVSALSRMTAEQLIATDSISSAILGSTGSFAAPDAASLSQHLAQYWRAQAPPPDGLPAAAPPAYWPLIRHLRIATRSPVLACGAVLVDLPGLGDNNAARNRVAEDFVKRADRFFVVAPITRAVSDKIATDLCGQAFRHQLQMDGNYHAHAITFIATKCDEISVEETVEDPCLGGLHSREFQQFEEEISKARVDQAAWRESVEKLEASVKAAEQAESHWKARLEEFRLAEAGKPTTRDSTECFATQAAPSEHGETRRKRQREESESGDDEEQRGVLKKAKRPSSHEGVHGRSPNVVEPEGHTIVEPNPAHELNMIEAYISEANNELVDCVRKLRSNHDLLKIASEKEQAAVRKRLAFCAAIRSEWAKKELQAQFRAGLDELEVSDIVNDQPVSEHREKPLPVFAVSSRDCMRLEGKLTDAGQQTCFSSKADTGIPKLRKWIGTITQSARERAVDRLLAQLREFIRNLDRWIDGIPGVTPEDREALRMKWSAKVTRSVPNGLSDRQTRRAFYRHRREAIVPRLLKEFEPIVDNLVGDLSRRFSVTLREKCRASAEAAAGDLLEVCENFVKGMRYNTYRAILRREGEYCDRTRNRKYNLNLDLATPFTKRISHLWSRVFKAKSLKTVEHRAAAKIEKLLAEVVASVPDYLRPRARALADSTLEAARSSLRDARTMVGADLENLQRETSRMLEPCVKKALISGYLAAFNAPRGVGCFARQQDIFKKHLELKRHRLFHDAAETVMEELEAAAAAVGKTLDNNLEDVAKQVQIDIAILWEECPLEGEEHTKARLQTKLLLQDMANEVDGWIRAKRIRDSLVLGESGGSG